MLLDSNVVVYACGQGREADLARRFIEIHAPSASVVSVVETLGYHRLQATERALLQAFFDATTVHPITDAVVEQAVRLRQRRRLSLGDAFIAGTALALQRPLVTHNTGDFGWIDGLDLIDPLDA